MTFVDFVTPVPADWLNNVNTFVNNPTTSVTYTAPGTGGVTQPLDTKLSQTINVLDYGADPTGVTDSTTAIQNAINAGGPNSRIVFPGGTFLVSATLIGAINQQLIGNGPNATTIQRFGDYGDTLVFPQASACVVKGFFFRHSTMPVAPFTTLANQTTTFPNSAHIRLQQAQGVLIEDVWAWRMPFQVAIDQGSLVTIHHCNLQGVWDGAQPATQEGQAAIIVGMVGYTQIVKVEKCYFGGSGNGPRTITWTTTDNGTHNQTNVIQNCGNKYAILIQQCEDFLCANSYMGGNWVACIGANLVPASVNLDWRFIGNFIDGAGTESVTGSLMFFTTQQDGTRVVGVTIADNVFNGEVQTYHGITVFNGVGTQPVIVDCCVTGNAFQAIVGGCIALFHAQGWTITGNVFAAYNCQGYSNVDPNFVTGIFVGSSSKNILCNGNIFGSTINAGSGNSFCYQTVATATGATGIVELNSFYNGAGTGGIQTGMSSLPGVSVSGNYVMVGHEQFLAVQAGAPLQITLPGNMPPGYTVNITDISGNAATNTTQVIGTVNGATNPVYNTNFFTKTLRSAGNGAWHVVGN